MPLDKMPTTIDEWNQLMADTAKTEGIDLAKASQEYMAHVTGEMAEAEKPTQAEPPKVTAPTKKEPKEGEEETVYTGSIEVNGQEITFEGPTEADVQRQIIAAQSAVLRASAEPPAAAKVDDKKGLTDDERFQIGLDIQQGKTEALDTYLEKSGAIDRYFEKQGIKLSDLKAATTERQTNIEHQSWQQATEKFVKMVTEGEVEYPHAIGEKGEFIGNKQNTYMVGMKIAQLGLPAEPESFVKAVNILREEGMLLPVEATAGKVQGTPTKKVVTSTTQFGASGNHGKPQASVPTGKQKIIKEAEWEAMNTYEKHDFYNRAVAEGFAPENIIVQR